MPEVFVDLVEGAWASRGFHIRFFEKVCLNPCPYTTVGIVGCGEWALPIHNCWNSRVRRAKINVSLTEQPRMDHECNTYTEHLQLPVIESPNNTPQPPIRLVSPPKHIVVLYGRSLSWGVFYDLEGGISSHPRQARQNLDAPRMKTSLFLSWPQT